MSYLPEKDAQEFAEKGILIGRTEPTRQSKGGWFDVYFWDNRLCACVTHAEEGVVCGEEIEEKELSLYVDEDIEDALKVLTAAREKLSE